MGKKGPYKDAKQRAKSDHPFSETERVAREYFDRGPSESKLEKNATSRRLQENTIDEYRKNTEKMKRKYEKKWGEKYPEVKVPKGGRVEIK